MILLLSYYLHSEEKNDKGVNMLKYIFILFFIIVIIMLIYIYHENRVFKVTRYSLQSDKLEGLKEEIRLVVLADLHNHVYGKNNDTLIKAIKEENPDLILVAGDLIIAKPNNEIDTATSLMKRLALKYPVYYGMGNHEYRLRIYPEQYGDMYERYTEELKQAGVHILENANEKVLVKNVILNIFGLEIDREYYKRFVTTPMQNNYIEDLVGQASAKDYNVLLAHNPKYFKSYAAWGADLTLSGHIHGGIVQIPFLGGAVSPQVEFFPKYDAGLFHEKDKAMILSRGLGTHTINVRINNTAELVSIKLKA